MAGRAGGGPVPKELCKQQAMESAPAASIYIGHEDITFMERPELGAVIEGEVARQRERPLKAVYGDWETHLHRADLGLCLTKSLEDLIDEVEAYRREWFLLEAIHQTPLPIAEAFRIDYQYDEVKVDKWIQNIAKEVEVPVAEPGLAWLGEGNFEIVDGSPGTRVLAGDLKNQLQGSLFLDWDQDLQIRTETAQPLRSPVLLASVNHQISSFTTYYPCTGCGRSHNLRLAADKVNGSILMPGEEFSYLEKISPVTAQAGYRYATIFLNGKPAEGIGGGVCQVSSTMYNAQLLAGIVASERQNHSRIVDYVPRGQDATVAERAIDYRFANPYDYPLYIRAQASDNDLTVEFWSNEKALNGVSYRPETTFKGITDNDRKIYDTTLYGYNAQGELLYREFLHRSFYR